MKPIIRKATIRDFDRLVYLYEQLTNVGDPDIFDINTHIYDNISVIIVDNLIVGTITLLIEPKIIHGGSKVGHIEDVVVDKDYRGLGLGTVLINHAVDVAKKMGCYKVILDCSNDMVKFYQKNGFEPKGVCMRLDL